MSGDTINLPGGLAIVLLVISSCGSADDGHGGAPRNRAVDAKPSAEEMIIGKWRMIAEEPANGKGGLFEQKRRLLELRADGTYHVENYVTSRDDRWSLEGDLLTFLDVRVVGGDIVTSIPDPKKPGEFLVVPTGQPREEIDKTMRVKVEKVDEDTLILVEDLPEIYQGEGPPRRVRNTYRRVSEAQLGPMMGGDIRTSVPSPGSYHGAYEYRMTKYPTMEIYISESIDGRATLMLEGDGTVGGCIGVAVHHHFSESEYSSSDGEHHTENREERWLAGASGRWKRGNGIATVSLDRFWFETCDTSTGEGDITGPVELECVAVAANEKLPVTALACKMIKDFTMLRELAINPADTERAGPYTLQIEPMGHISPDTGEPWLILGASPGLVVKSTDDRSVENPTVTFTAAEIDFVESMFKKKDDPADLR